MRTLSLIYIFFAILLTPSICIGESDFTVYIGDVPPFNYRNEQGVADGVGVKVVVESMNKVGIPLNAKDILSISWPRAVEDTESVPGTIIIGMAWTPQRNDRFKWVGPIGRVRLGLVAKKETKATISSPDDLKNYKIGVIRNSAPVHILETQFGVEKSELHELIEDAQMFKMLDVGRVDLITQADTAAPSGIKAAGLELDDYEMVFTLFQLELYAAFNKATDDALIKRVQQALDEMKVKPKNGLSQYDVILKEYMKDGVIKIH